MNCELNSIESCGKKHLSCLIGTVSFWAFRGDLVYLMYKWKCDSAQNSNPRVWAGLWDLLDSTTDTNTNTSTFTNTNTRTNTNTTISWIFEISQINLGPQMFHIHKVRSACKGKLISNHWNHWNYETKISVVVFAHEQQPPSNPCWLWDVAHSFPLPVPLCHCGTQTLCNSCSKIASVHPTLSVCLCSVYLS